MKDIIFFMTHNFSKIFLSQLLLLDSTLNTDKYDAIVLLDNSHSYNMNITKIFKNIKFELIGKISTSYDYKGHTLYLNYIKQHETIISKYNYFWFIENDVYFNKSFQSYFEIHEQFNYDLMVVEYGTRFKDWTWLQQLKGFKETKQIGVLGCIFRASSKFVEKLVETIDLQFHGFLEVILPHICLEYDMTIHQFIPDFTGIVFVNPDDPVLKLVTNDILNNTSIVLQDKLYHPIKG
jgi:hypothetical protein